MINNITNNKMKSTQIIKEWLFCSTENRYIHKILSKEKELEVDIDGTIYFNIKFDYTPVQFSVLKNRIDEMFESDGEHQSKTEYYYIGPVSILSYCTEKKEMCIDITCGNDELFEAFLRWDANATNVVSFLQKYCL